MVSRRSARFVLVAVLASAVAFQALPAHAAGLDRRVTTAVKPAAGSVGANPKLMCSRQLQQVCAAVFGPLCTLRPTACPTAAPARMSASTAAPRWACIPDLQDVCYVIGLVVCHFHACYASSTARVQTETWGGMRDRLI